MGSEGMDSEGMESEGIQISWARGILDMCKTSEPLGRGVLYKKEAGVSFYTSSRLKLTSSAIKKYMEKPSRINF